MEIWEKYAIVAKWKNENQKIYVIYDLENDAYLGKNFEYQKNIDDISLGFQYELEAQLFLNRFIYPIDDFQILNNIAFAIAEAEAGDNKQKVILLNRIKGYYR